jgi:hypothetical protein
VAVFLRRLIPELRPFVTVLGFEEDVMIAIFRQIADTSTYEFVRDAKPGHGPAIPGLAVRITSYLEEQAKNNPPAEEEPLRWRLTGNELLKRSLTAEERQEIERFKLVADIQNVLGNPRRSRAHMMEICDIWGFSGWGWTPMMWRLRELFEDDAEPPRSQNRWPFVAQGGFVHEFLHLMADHNREETRKGRRDFGPNGKYNGTLLWPAALDYFLAELGYKSRSVLTAGGVALPG